MIVVPPALGEKARLLWRWRILWWFEFRGFLGQLLLFGHEAAFDFFDIFGGGKRFGNDAPVDEQLADFAVVFHVLTGDDGFRLEFILFDVEIGDFVGEILGLNGDGGEEIGKRPAFGDAELVFHVLGGFAAEESRVAFAADAGEALVVVETLEDDAGEFLFGGGEFFAGADAFGLGKALLDDFLFACLNGKVGLSEGDLVLGGIAIYAMR
jgi:hypothetical protein